jgi:triacylglycerol esterase/lipase EstA (alpha/beta hydrolase family)
LTADRVPVLLVHGIWDTRARLAPLERGLVARGLGPVYTVELLPNDGRAPIATLGRRVAEEAEALSRRESADRIDLVGFSMGALVSRWYLQRGGGKDRVLRFVSLSGPHHGTATAFALPLAGARDMRPGSALLRDLETDRDPWGEVEVHCVYTPYDLMIVPARSSVLEGATTVCTFPVVMHRMMIRDARVLDHVARILGARGAREPEL